MFDSALSHVPYINPYQAKDDPRDDGPNKNGDLHKRSISMSIEAILAYSQFHMELSVSVVRYCVLGDLRHFVF